MEGKKKKFDLVLRLENGIEIRSNRLNWILFLPPKTFWYYNRLYSLFDDLFDLKIKFYSARDERKTLEGLRDCIEVAENGMVEIIKGLTTISPSLTLPK